LCYVIPAPHLCPLPYYPRMPIGKVWIYRLLFVFFVILCVCTVTDFSGEDKASGVKFCTAFHRCHQQGISHSGEHCSSRSSPEAQNWVYAVAQFVWGLIITRGPCACRFVQGVRSACVDRRPSPKTDVLVSLLKRTPYFVLIPIFSPRALMVFQESTFQRKLSDVMVLRRFIGTDVNRCFLEPTKFVDANGISIASAIFVRLAR